MQQELNSLIKLNLEAAFTISNNLNTALDELLKEFTSQLDSVCTPLGLKINNKVNFKERYTGIWIYKDEWKFANIGFQFQNYDKELIFGIAAKRNPKDFPIDLRALLNALPGNNKKINDWWPWYNFVESPYRDWRKLGAWKAVEDGSMREMMKEKIEFLVKMIGENNI